MITMKKLAASAVRADVRAVGAAGLNAAYAQASGLPDRLRGRPDGRNGAW
jgi:hypothetical protein